MKKLVSLSALTSFILTAGSAFAATPVSMNAGSMAYLKNQFQATSGTTAATQDNSLKELSSSQDFNKVYHQRMQQMYQGVPVIGGYVIVHSKKSNGFAAASQANATGTVYRSLAGDLGAKPQDQSKKALEKWIAPYQQAKLSEKEVQLVVFIDDADQAHWAYKVAVKAEDGKNIPSKPSAYLDAKTLKPLVQWNDIKTEKHQAYAKGFGGNERAGKYVYDSTAGNYPLLEITRDDDSEKCFMETNLVKVIDMEGDYSTDGRPMTFDCHSPVDENTYMTGHDADGYDKINGAHSPSNDAAYIGYVIHHMYKEWYGVDALKNRDGSTMQVVMRVHYGNRYQNAFWDGKQMTYGDGGSMMYPLVSMGVGAHEISHGFTQQHSNLQYYGQSGGMNESFSDMAAMASIFYSFNESETPSFKIGDRIMKKSSGYDALRYMDVPSKDGRSIDSAKDYRDGIDVHYSSGVFNRLFYLMATTEGWNTRKAFDVMVQANSHYWGPYEKFKTGGCKVLKATNDYGYPVEDVAAALEKVGIDPDRCEV